MALRSYTKNNSEVDLVASTLEEALMKLNEHFPGFRSLLVDEGGSLRKYVNIFVNEDDIRNKAGLATTLKEGDRVHIVPSVAGGI
jgi:adenylyltransferase/sulfurtransferase